MARKKVKALHFRSKEAYMKWLAHGHIHGEFKKVKGHQRVCIAGKPHRVRHGVGKRITVRKKGSLCSRCVSEGKCGTAIPSSWKPSMNRCSEFRLKSSKQKKFEVAMKTARKMDKGLATETEKNRWTRFIDGFV